MFLFNLLPKHSSHGHRSSQLGLPHELPGWCPIPQLADLHRLHHRLASVDDRPKSVLHIRTFVARYSPTLSYAYKEDLAVVMKLQASKYQFTLQPIRSHGKKHQMTQVLLNLRACGQNINNLGVKNPTGFHPPTNFEGVSPPVERSRTACQQRYQEPQPVPECKGACWENFWMCIFLRGRQVAGWIRCTKWN